MKKLLFLLSNSILFSLSALFIYNLNSKNNSENSSFVLKQTKKEETDLSKIFDNRAYISIQERDKDPKPKVVNALKAKFPTVDFSQLEIDVKPDRGGVDVFINPKQSSKYKNKAKIPCYPKEDVSKKFEHIDSRNLESIEINTEKEIQKAINKKGISSQPEVDFKIINIRESSATLESTLEGDFYGLIEVKFIAANKNLSSIIYESSIKVNKPTTDEIANAIKKQYPSIKNENLDLQIDEEKKTIKITINSKTTFVGSVLLTYELPKTQELPKKPLESKTDKNLDSEMLSDQPQETPKKPSEGSTIKNENKKQPESEPDLSNLSTSNQPESKSNKTMNYNPPVIDKSLKSNSNTSNLQIPNKESSNSKTGSKGSKTGVIVGSTLGVSGVVVTGAIGSWIYFKKRK
ncbi:hypothetical protein [Mycoplasma feriruminatoris]|uniref:Uncharacterized protein n=1 Tax=Mycoplasma feriruminatoris TaxID=1179777 RepID=A0AAQ3HWT8_9MOLU|nr:hypothetical protein [Mycoplasma feriruminatoris]WFQ92567.1 hypothetical protein MFERI14822_00348 [Mycoplasma feriruminatoris]WFQ94275.1 hypothetical protein MFERI15220_00346 [Mycoplasma feriruminatoris]WFQ95099.1 hypothetical protein MFERI15407_00350 [Mycoplasma feriruminatoris]